MAVFTLAVALAALETRQELVPDDPFAVRIWISALLLGVVLGGVMLAAAVAVALLARR